jgi:hypothetical protein
MHIPTHEKDVETVWKLVEKIRTCMLVGAEAIGFMRVR